MTAWINHVLSKLFPPKFPSGLVVKEDRRFHEQGSAGPVKPKVYLNGIDRHFKQLEAEEQDSELMRMFEQEMRECWEQKRS